MNTSSTVTSSHGHSHPTPVTATPSPSITFASLALAEPLQRALNEKNYTEPSPIQAQSIPYLLQGRDLIGVAQTGTGKTAAFALPILQRLSANPTPAMPKRPRALILAPTRELAAQIAQSFGTYGKFLKLSHAAVFGGVSLSPQIRALSRGVDILIATPGRLADLERQKHLSLDKVEIFVLDEADRMLDLGFVHEIKRIITKPFDQADPTYFFPLMAQTEERLGYRPNELARGLKAQRSAAIGMIVPNLADPFTANAVNAVQEVARANGYVVILASSGGDLDVERSEIVSLVGRQIDGLIVAPADSRTDSFSDFIPDNVPAVTFDQLVRNPDLDSVTVTNRRSAREATSHLVSHGLRRIVAIGARPHLYTCRERVAGYRAGIKAGSLEPRVCLVEHESMLTAAWLDENVLRLQKADAILTLNWVCTILTLRALRELGKTAGRDIPMLSFDDFDLAYTLFGQVIPHADIFKR